MLDSAAQEFRRPCCAAPRHKPRVAIRLLPTRKKSASADTYRERKVCRRDSREIEGWNAESAERVNTAPSSAALRAAFGQSHAQSAQRRGPHYLSRRLCANSGMRSKVALHRRSALSPATSDVVEVPGLQRVCNPGIAYPAFKTTKRNRTSSNISHILSNTTATLSSCTTCQFRGSSRSRLARVESAGSSAVWICHCSSTVCHPGAASVRIMYWRIRSSP
jgi:hypothetical protein